VSRIGSWSRRESGEKYAESQIFCKRAGWKTLKAFPEMIPRLGEKYKVEMAIPIWVFTEFSEVP